VSDFSAGRAKAGEEVKAYNFLVKKGGRNRTSSDERHQGNARKGGGEKGALYQKKTMGKGKGGGVKKKWQLQAESAGGRGRGNTESKKKQCGSKIKGDEGNGGGGSNPSQKKDAGE